MHKLRVVTNDSFERYIDYLSLKAKFESTHRKLKFEDRFSDLDLDDITANITAPTDGEVANAVRELDLFDDMATKVGAKDIGVDSDGKLRILDLDEPDTVTPIGQPYYRGDDRTAGLDLDSTPGKVKDHPEDDKVRELDFDDVGAKNSKSKSNIGAIGALDYDDDIDMSGIAASIDDVYAALASYDPKTVKSIVKRYSADIKDKNKIRDALLIHASNLNLPCLRILCGDMKITLTAKEKEVGYIDKADIAAALDRFKSVASSLTGANNTYGLIPNAIVSCTPETQVNCINVVDFLKEWCNLPIIPLYFRGALIRHCYDLASYLLDEINNEIPLDIYVGPKGIITRMKTLNDIPSSLLSRIVDGLLKVKRIGSQTLGDLIIVMAENHDRLSIKKLFDSLSEVKQDLVLDYIEDTDYSVFQIVSKLVN